MQGLWSTTHYVKCNTPFPSMQVDFIL